MSPMTGPKRFQRASLASLGADRRHREKPAFARLKARLRRPLAAPRALTLALLIMSPAGVSAPRAAAAVPDVLVYARDAGEDNAYPVKAGDASDDPPESELDPIQAQADYTREAASPHSHFLDYVALFLGLAAVLLWLFGSGLVLRLRGDILPLRIKTRLDRLDAHRLAIAASLRSLAAAEPAVEWPEERRRYDGVAASANAFLETAKEGLKLGAIDDASLILELDRIVLDAEALAARLQSLAPAPFAAAERIDLEGLSRVQRINRNWERVFASGELSKLITLGQLTTMRWPNWSRLATPR